MDQLNVGAGAALSERHLERVEDEVRAHVRRELPADDGPAEGVDHEREEDEAFRAAQVAEVGDPELVRTRRAEVALDEIGPPPCPQVRLGRAPRLAPPLRDPGETSKRDSPPPEQRDPAQPPFAAKR